MSKTYLSQIKRFEFEIRVQQWTQYLSINDIVFYGTKCYFGAEWKMLLKQIYIWLSATLPVSKYHDATLLK